MAAGKLGLRQRFTSNPDDVFFADVRRPSGRSASTTSSSRVPIPHTEEYRLLCNAVIDGRIDVLTNLLVDRKLDVNARCSTGETAGHQAAMEGCEEAMSTLICYGFDIDAVDDEGNTALHVASRHGNVGVAKRLTEALPNEELRNRRGFTALDEAIKAGWTECTSCIRDFAECGKAQALQDHCLFERDRLMKERRNKEILYGRDMDLQPGEHEFRSKGVLSVTTPDRALICASMLASAVAKRSLAAGLHAAEMTLERDVKRPSDTHGRGLLHN